MLPLPDVSAAQHSSCLTLSLPNPPVPNAGMMSVCPLKAVGTLRCPYVPYVPLEAVPTLICPYVPYVPLLPMTSGHLTVQTGHPDRQTGKSEHLIARTEREI